MSSIKIILVILFLTSLIGMELHRNQQQKRILETLRSIKSNEIMEFKIYPRVGLKPAGSPVFFDKQDFLVNDFFQLLSDVHSYSPDHDTCASFDLIWFVELATKGVELQIGFSIPSNKGELVIGYLAKGHETNPQFYGMIQSRQLYQWYQTYSHR